MKGQRCLRLILFCLLWAGLAPRILAAQSAAPSVYVLTIDGEIVTQTMTDYFRRGLEAAENAGADALLLQLNTPGGDVSATLDIVTLFRGAAIPILVYVGPAGAQAASAGSIITLAGHANGMAPETIIGAASPISGDGSDLNDTSYSKIVNDLQAVMRSLTADRGPEATALAESMIDEATAVTAEEALAVKLIDAVANSRAEFLNTIDGRPVTVNQQTLSLRTAGAQQTMLPLTFIENLLFLLTNPILLGTLLAIGVQAILIELSSPGGYVAGAVGIICLGLALYGYGQLPTNWLGLGLIALAFMLFFLEIKTGTGALAIAGTLALVTGLLVLTNAAGRPEFTRLSLPGALGISLATATIFLWIVGKALRAQQRRALTGREGLAGKTGRVRRQFAPAAGAGHFEGSVLVNGELWRARSAEALADSIEVTITQADGFTLEVEKKNEV